MTTKAEVVQAFGQMPMPSFAVDCDVQVDGSDSYRVLMGRDRDADPFTVGTTAVQYLDGHIDVAGNDEPKVWIGNTGFSTVQARRLAATLVAAADELDAVIRTVGEPATHACPFAWCRSNHSNVDYEHWGDSEISIGDHCPDVETIACFAFVTDEPDGTVYDDEISFLVFGPDRTELALSNLTDHEARQIRNMLDQAIAHRAEVRKL